MLNYNLPPHLISKPFHMMLALLILGKKQVENINVFLEPLIDEYLDLWKGIPDVDVSRPIGKLLCPYLSKTLCCMPFQIIVSKNMAL